MSSCAPERRTRRSGRCWAARSVLLLDGDEHLRQRRLMLPSFHGERMREYETVMTAAADRAIDSWPVGETVHAAAARCSR